MLIDKLIGDISIKTPHKKLPEERHVNRRHVIRDISIKTPHKKLPEERHVNRHVNSYKVSYIHQGDVKITQ